MLLSSTHATRDTCVVVTRLLTLPVARTATVPRAKGDVSQEEVEVRKTKTNKNQPTKGSRFVGRSIFAQLRRSETGAESGLRHATRSPHKKNRSILPGCTKRVAVLNDPTPTSYIRTSSRKPAMHRSPNLLGGCCCRRRECRPCLWSWWYPRRQSVGGPE